MMSHDTTPQTATGLSRQQLTAIVELLLGSTVTEAAKEARVDRTTVHRWLSSDALFVATMNRLKREELDAIRSRMRSAAVTAVETVEELMEGADVHPAIRLRAALAVLEAAGGLEPERIGPTGVEEVQAEFRRAQLRSIANPFRSSPIPPVTRAAPDAVGMPSVTD
jgi:hypothetical protein